MDTGVRIGNSHYPGGYAACVAWHQHLNSVARAKDIIKMPIIIFLSLMTYGFRSQKWPWQQCLLQNAAGSSVKFLIPEIRAHITCTQLMWNSISTYDCTQANSDPSNGKHEPAKVANSKYLFRRMLGWTGKNLTCWSWIGWLESY